MYKYIYGGTEHTVTAEFLQDCFVFCPEAIQAELDAWLDNPTATPLTFEFTAPPLVVRLARM